MITIPLELRGFPQSHDLDKFSKESELFKTKKE
jgi:hypothetical protein